MIELFLICALSLPPANFQHGIISYHAIRTEEDQLKDYLRRKNNYQEVFITPKGNAERLKESGFEKTPFTYNQKEIWIQRKEKSDKRPIESAA